MHWIAVGWVCAPISRAVMFTILICWLLRLQSKDVEICPFKTTVCLKYNDKRPIKSKWHYVQNIVISPDRSWKKSNISSFLSMVHSFPDGKEIALVPWHHDRFNPGYLYLTQRCSFPHRTQVNPESTEPQTEQLLRCYRATLNPFESFGYCQAVQTIK